MNGEVWVHDLPGLQSRQIEGAKMHSGSHIIDWAVLVQQVSEPWGAAQEL